MFEFEQVFAVRHSKYSFIPTNVVFFPAKEATSHFKLSIFEAAAFPTRVHALQNTKEKGRWVSQALGLSDVPRGLSER